MWWDQAKSFGEILSSPNQREFIRIQPVPVLSYDEERRLAGMIRYKNR
jgi:hypothetical protein